MKIRDKYFCDLCKLEIENRKKGILNNLSFGDTMKPSREVCFNKFTFNSLVGLFSYKRIFFFRTRFDECYQELCDDCTKEIDKTINKLYKEL